MNKNTRIPIALLFALFFQLSTAHAGLLYTYSRLATKDLDQMNKLIKEKIKESRADGADKTVPLKEALQAVFSRPNEDFMIEKVIAPLRNELDDTDSWDKSVRALVKEAIGALNNPKAFKPEAQVTYEIFLENIIGEMRPHAREPFEGGIIKQIRDAKIELTKQAIQERQLRMMRDIESPSVIAGRILADAEKAPTDAAKDNAEAAGDVGAVAPVPVSKDAKDKKDSGKDSK